MSVKIKVWLDDVREMPEHFDVHVRTAEEAIRLLSTHAVSEISLDHDLGEDMTNGYQVAKFIEEGAFTGFLLRLGVFVHTDNAGARPSMVAAIKNARKYWDTREGSEDVR